MDETGVEVTAQQLQAQEAGETTTPTPATPLTDIPDDEDADARRQKELERTFWTRLWQGVAAVSFVINIVAMVIEKSGVMIVAGLIALLIAPVVVVEQMKLQDLDSLRKAQNHLRKEVNRFQIENNKLHLESNRLETQVGKLKNQENKLDEITKRQGTSVASFVELVKENQVITDQLKSAVNAETLQTLVTAIIESDFDSSGKFSDQEIQILQLRMSNLPGITVDAEQLQRRVTMGDRQLSTVLSLILDVEREDVPEEERVFHVESDKVVEDALEKKF